METVLKDELVKKILSLTPMDRIEIVDKVMDGFISNDEYNYDSVWAEESERRVDAVHEGTIQMIPANEVFSKINNLK